MKSRDDPTIARIRETRHRISARFGHDPQKLVAYYIELQEKYRDRLWDDSKRESAQATRTLAGVMREEEPIYSVGDGTIEIPVPGIEPIQNARGFLKGIDTTIEREPDRL